MNLLAPAEPSKSKLHLDVDSYVIAFSKQSAALFLFMGLGLILKGHG